MGLVRGASSPCSLFSSDGDRQGYAQQCLMPTLDLHKTDKPLALEDLKVYVVLSKFLWCQSKEEQNLFMAFVLVVGTSPTSYSLAVKRGVPTKHSATSNGLSFEVTGGCSV